MGPDELMDHLQRRILHTNDKLVVKHCSKRLLKLATGDERDATETRRYIAETLMDHLQYAILCSDHPPVVEKCSIRLLALVNGGSNRKAIMQPHPASTPDGFRLEICPMCRLASLLTASRPGQAEGSCRVCHYQYEMSGGPWH